MASKADKLWKKSVRDQQKRIKPGECQKYVRLVLDVAVMNQPYGHDLLVELSQCELKYEIRKLAESNCIIWERSIGQRSLQPTAANEDVGNNNGGTGSGSGSGLGSGNGLGETWQRENQVIRLLSTQELQQAIRTSALETLAESFKAAFPEMRHTVLVSREKSTKTASATEALISLQVEQEISVLQVPTGVKEQAALLRRFTKAIAEAPYKQQKTEILGGFKKFLANDKKQCVRVVGTTGFGRLWQQHLNRLPQVTLEVAETIIGQYPCPKKLIAEYADNANAVSAIADLKISRSGPKPLQTDRRIGSVLSGKLHTLYNTRDPHALL